MKIAVCMITLQRPEGLGRLLTGINALTFRGEPPELEIIVVDNDSSRSAEEVCNALRPALQWPLRYDVEPRRGIPFARNKAVACALETADFVAFIDDDEAPEPNWLDELLNVQRTYDADVVTGPVVPRFPDQVPTWIIRGRFFETPRHHTGRRMDVAYTHNVLARSDVYRNMEMVFDERTARTGWDDSHFFRRVRQAGFSIVWADAAVVHEWIPKSRACFRWLVQRSFRSGNGLGFITLDLGSAWSGRLMLTAKAAVWIAMGILLAPLGLLAGRHVFVRGVRYIAYGAGYLASIAGTRYEEYKRVHGT